MTKQTLLYLSRRPNMKAIVRRSIAGLVLSAISLQCLFAFCPPLTVVQASQAKPTTFRNNPLKPDADPASSDSSSYNLKSALADSNSNELFEPTKTKTTENLRAPVQTPAKPEVANPGRIIFGVGGVYNGLLMTNSDGTNPVNLTDSGAAQIKHPSVSAQTGMIAFDAQNIQITPPLPDKDRRIFVINYI